MAKRYRTVRDLSNRLFTRNVIADAIFTNALKKLAPTKLYMHCFSNPDSLPVEEIERIRAERHIGVPAANHAYGHLCGYKNQDTGVIAQYSHFYGPNCIMETDEVTLMVSGPEKVVVKKFLTDLDTLVKKEFGTFKSEQKKTGKPQS